MTNNKTFLLLTSPIEVHACLKAHRELFQDSQVLLTASHAANFLEEKQISFQRNDVYLSFKEEESNLDLANSIAINWFKDSQNNDLSLVDGISLGYVFMYRFWCQLLYIINSICWIQNFLEREKPAKIIWYENIAQMGCGDFTGGANIPKLLLKEFQKKSDYDIEVLPCDSEENWEPKISIQEKLQAILKKVVIFIVDKSKKILEGLTDESKKTKILIPSATDISYLKDPLLNYLLELDKEIRILYAAHQKNCYFHSRMIRAEASDQTSLKNEMQRVEIELEKIHDKLLHNLESKDFGEFKDVDIRQFFKVSIDILFKNHRQEFVENYVFLKSLIDKKDITLTMLSNHATWKSRLLSLLGRDKNLPVVVCPHGFTYAYQRDGEYFNHPENNLKCFPFFHSHEVTGLNQNYYVRKKDGIDPKRMIVNGIFQYSRIAEINEASKLRERRGFGISSKMKVVLFTPDIQFVNEERGLTLYLWSGFQKWEFYKKLLRLFHNQNDYHLILKFRPTDQLFEPTRAFWARENIKNCSIHTQHLQKFLNLSDSLLVVNTSVAYEALYYNIPIVVMETEEKRNILSLDEVGASVAINKIEQLIPCLDRIENDPDFRSEMIESQKKYLRDNFSDSPDEAERLAKTLLNFTKNKFDVFNPISDIRG